MSEAKGKNHLRVCIVGPKGAGKTSLINTMLSKKFEELEEENSIQIMSKMKETVNLKVKVNNVEWNLDVVDTPGDSAYKQIRPLVYNNIDVYILAFSLCDDFTFMDMDEFYDEVKSYSSEEPLTVLVANKLETKEIMEECNEEEKKKLKMNGISFVKADDIEELKEEVKPFRYIECSARENKNITKVFEACVEAYLAKQTVKEEKKAAEGKQMQIRKKEFSSVWQSLFEAVDKNKDGKVTSMEAKEFYKSVKPHKDLEEFLIFPLFDPPKEVAESSDIKLPFLPTTSEKWEKLGTLLAGEALEMHEDYWKGEFMEPLQKIVLAAKGELSPPTEEKVEDPFNGKDEVFSSEDDDF
mmetsp:Transcript_2562/g.3699  ORF Transcript_2562/g.3699 Transcript_2562/m.3699 type:complete len:354 (-) Transcript_2562:23-1084(-)